MVSSGLSGGLIHEPVGRCGGSGGLRMNRSACMHHRHRDVRNRPQIDLRRVDGQATAVLPAWAPAHARHGAGCSSEISRAAAGGVAGT